MANIKVNDIKPAGVELFIDSEGFMSELDEHDINYIYGGAKGSVVTNNCTMVAGCIKTK